MADQNNDTQVTAENLAQTVVKALKPNYGTAAARAADKIVPAKLPGADEEDYARNYNTD
jgi:hypothetical protein